MSDFPQWAPNSVQVVVRDTVGQVLLQKRADFRIWSLPGGRIERGETPESAALREILEETGLSVELVRCIGYYWRPEMPGGGSLIQVFTARVLATVAAPGWESAAVGWFSLERLPRSVPHWTRVVLQDAASSIREPIRRVQRLSVGKAFLLRVLFALRTLMNRLRGRSERERGGR